MTPAALPGAPPAPPAPPHQVPAGRVVAWGNNGNGQANVPARITDAIAITPPADEQGGRHAVLGGRRAASSAVND